MRITAVAPGIIGAGVLIALVARSPAVLPVAIALALLVAFARRSGHGDTTRWLAAAAGVSSLILTVSVRLMPLRLALIPMLLEALLLGVTVFASARWAPLRAGWLGGVLAGLAIVSAMFRSPEDIDPAVAAAAGGTWALGPVAVAAFGLHLRHLQTARERAVREARRAQRLQLARDLHDYVAHDLTEMIVYAQTAQLSAVTPAAGASLRHIEQAGLRAMAVMDRTVRMLHGHRSDDAAGTLAPPGIDDLPDLTRRFATASSARVSLTLDPAVTSATPREVDGTVHRIVVEALTNVRRHAPAATRIMVDVRRIRDTVEVSVTNDAGAAPHVPAGRRGGLGITGLTERVAALGGTLVAGPHGTGWRLRAVVPAGHIGAPA